MEEQRYGGDAAAARSGPEVGGRASDTFSPAQQAGSEHEHRDQAAAAATAQEGLNDDTVLARHNLRFSALRNAFYHSARLRFYEWLHRALMFGIVLTGTAGVSNILTSWAGDRWFAGITALLATLDLVLDLRGKAQLHDSLKRRYFMLLARLDEKPDAGPRQLARWQGRIMAITAEEPVTYRAVDAVAHNEAIDTLGLDPAQKQVLTGRQYRWRHFTTAQGVTFPYAGEAKAD